MKLGTPHLHLRSTDSTNARARELALAGAPHGAMVTAEQQTAGRGRQGRTWSAPAGQALLMSVLVRDPPPLLPLVAGVAVAEVAGAEAMVKWPNDVLVGGRKVCGILAEGRPADGWAVLGIGLNAAVRLDELPTELRETAGSLGLEPAAIGPTREAVLRSLERWLAAPADDLLAALRARDALLGRVVEWDGGRGLGDGIDGEGRLVVTLDGGGRTELAAGEVHLGR